MRPRPARAALRRWTARSLAVAVLGALSLGCAAPQRLGTDQGGLAPVDRFDRSRFHFPAVVQVWRDGPEGTVLARVVRVPGRLPPAHRPTLLCVFAGREAGALGAALLRRVAMLARGDTRVESLLERKTLLIAAVPGPEWGADERQRDALLARAGLAPQLLVDYRVAWDRAAGGAVGVPPQPEIRRGDDEGRAARHLEVARGLARVLSANGPRYTAAAEADLGAALLRQVPWYRWPWAPRYRAPAGSTPTARALRDFGLMGLRVEVRHDSTSEADLEALTTQHLAGVLYLLDRVTFDPFADAEPTLND